MRSSFLCSPLFASSLLPRPVQLALLRAVSGMRLRHRSPAPSTSSSAVALVRSWQALHTTCQWIGAGSSATPIASKYRTFYDPFGSQSPPLETLEVFVCHGSGSDWSGEWAACEKR